MVKQKEKLNIMIDDISDEGVDFHSIEPENVDDDENISIEEPKTQESLNSVNSDDSVRIYLQQIGRCIFSEDPEHPTPDEDRPIIFDGYNNYLAQNMDREANKTNSTSDLQRLQRIINWIDTHKGYMPDINSEDIKEAKKAITLKNIQNKK